jgi:UDP-N-acetylmuramoyl-tripeptide--D-alanyl-D-alanine ligase
MFQLSEAAAALAADCGARHLGADVRIESVGTDSRAAGPGQLFVAIAGERFDGHDFIAQALAQGASAALLSDPARAAELHAAHPQAALLLVDDTRRALAALAAWWRRRHAIPLIAIAGSNGKTTVKEMLAAVLRAGFGQDAVLATPGNWNNDIGLPLTLLRLRAEHRAAAIELGMNHPGETAELAAIAAPTVAIVNNAQREHQEFMRSVEAVAEEHGALIAALSADGVAVLNADDAFFGYWQGLLDGRRALGFGLYAAAHAQGSARADADGIDLTLRLGDGPEATVRLAIPGLHNARNALAVAAAASAVGLPLADIARGLAAFAPARGRLQTKRRPDGGVVIDDSYNANPDSVRAAIDVLAGLPGARLLVLGDMAEVGDAGPAFHAEVGAYARERGIPRLLAFGPASRATAEAFGPGAEHFEDIDALNARALALTDAGTAVLVKGSRSMGLERVVAALGAA